MLTAWAFAELTLGTVDPEGVELTTIAISAQLLVRSSPLMSKYDVQWFLFNLPPRFQRRKKEIVKAFGRL